MLMRPSQIMASPWGVLGAVDGVMVRSLAHGVVFLFLPSAIV